MNQSGSILQSINNALHNPPLSFLFYGIYWSVVLVVLSPIFGIALLLQTVFRFLQYTLIRESKIDAKKCQKQLAVYITGCDSGFGREIAFRVSDLGFVVFAGCLSEKSFEQFQGISSIIPLRVDVTQKDQVLEASNKISTWLSSSNTEKEGKKTTRCLHAVINNAGVGTTGFIDWLDINDFRKDMEVNYFGTIQITKSILPILKSQASTNRHSNARIINMTSGAGLIAMPCGATYIGSKFATEAFSTCLRLELKAFDLAVTTINPSYHQTAMREGMMSTLNEKWEKIGKEMRREYGDEFFTQVKKSLMDLPENMTWDANNVVDQVVFCVEMEKSPPPQVIVGSDLKFGLLILRHLPVWLQDWILSVMLPTKRAAAMMKN